MGMLLLPNIIIKLSPIPPKPIAKFAFSGNFHQHSLQICLTSAFLRYFRFSFFFQIYRYKSEQQDRKIARIKAYDLIDLENWRAG